jgi:hypothetical protein
VILDCDRLWTQLVTAVYRVRRLPRVTNDPPVRGRAPALVPSAGGGTTWNDDPAAAIERMEPDPRAELSAPPET